MIILPIKSRLQIVKERENPKDVWTGKYVILIIAETPNKNKGPTQFYRSINFCRILPVVTKKFHKKAVIRNKYRRILKEAFRQIDKTLLKNQHDYQLIIRKSIVEAKFISIIKDIEKCLQGKAIQGFPVDNKKNKK